jgi:glycosyltransferase involved in cell wall biosynthesis
MKVLHITFRYGFRVYGGAEYYLRKLNEELQKKDFDITVCTTKANSIEPLGSYGVSWDNSLENENSSGVNVLRFPVKNPNPYISPIFERSIKNELHRAYFPRETVLLDTICRLYNKNGAILLDGWYSPEGDHASVSRWTEQKARILINESKLNALQITMLNQVGENSEIILDSANFKKIIPIPRSNRIQTIKAILPDISGKVHVTFKVEKTERYLDDSRDLGMKIYEILYHSDGFDRTLSLENDHEFIKLRKISYIDYLISQAESRRNIYSILFDYLRGPNSTQMQRWLNRNIINYDIIMAQMFPFNTIKYAIASKRFGKPIVLLPLMHVDDAFYHWKHYYEFLRSADCIFAVSNFSKKNLFDKIGARSTCIGAGVDKAIFIEREIKGDDFRKKYDLDNKDIVLTVSRKQQTKRYDMLIEAMRKVRARFKDAHLVLIGPDDDKIPIKNEGVSYLGIVSEEDLIGAYDACEIFAMMSISESFGMVFCEAWSRKKPVIGNINCGPVSTLIDDNYDGFLCSNTEELAERIEMLMYDRNLARKFGDNGFRKVINNFTWDNVANRVYSCYTKLIEQYPY